MFKTALKLTHVSHFPQTIDKEIEGKCIIIYISVL